MQTQKFVNLLNDSEELNSKFATKNGTLLMTKIMETKCGNVVMEMEMWYRKWK